MMTETQSYGEMLPDQVERISKLFHTHLEVINDVQEFYVARVALEREHATKLQQLVRKASEKKSRIESLFVLGEEPTKSWDNQTLKKSTLNTVYDGLITSVADSAQDYIKLADTITSRVIEPLRTLERGNEERNKKQMAFFQKLLSDRDRIYNERLKSKHKYDEECAEVELFRQKQGRANDDRHADRAAKQAEHQRNEMLNSKNVYLISISIANQVKQRFYKTDLPRLENEFQSLQSQLIRQFVGILQHSQTIQLDHLESAKARLAGVTTKLELVDVARDQELFIQHNIQTFMPLEDWKFEPCPIHYDSATMNVEPVPKVFMQNKLRQCRDKLAGIRPVMDTQRSELKRLSASSEADKDDRLLEARHQLVFYETSETILNAEIDTIIAGVGDDGGALQPHNFKSTSFSIPTQCAYCKSTIWGLSKQGKTCKSCGLSVHTKCELKLSASCEQPTANQPSSFTHRKSASLSRHQEPGPALVPSASSFVQPSPSEDNHEERPQATVLYDFEATSEFELGVFEGLLVRIVEPDDGSGWVKVADEEGNSGLVPAAYLETGGGRSAQETISLKRGHRVRAIYPYKGQSPEELDLHEGQILELSLGPNGGQNYGNGWWEGFDSNGKKGIFPSNYVEAM